MKQDKAFYNERMMAMVKAVALDMDGTLLDENHHVSEEVTELLKRWQSLGIRVFLATGRTALEAADVLPEGFTPDGIVGANGMVVMVVKGDETEGGASGRWQHALKLKEHAVDRDLVKDLLTNVQLAGIYYEIHPAEGKRFALAEDRSMLEAEVIFPEDTTVALHESKSRQEAVDTKISWVDELPDVPVVKIYFFSKSKEAVSRWKQLITELGKCYSFTTSSSSEHNVEIMADGVNKATGVEALLDYYHVTPQNLLAIGDANNDLPMLKLAGHPVVMKNGSEDLRRQFEQKTRYTHNENGVYDYLLGMEMRFK
ncbi:HAD family hydrolase [Salisediminibacterium beveridgei]|nr:HAD family hydrolase [Salisediminibacterium beveridgei]